jgi:hypothetical protein
MFLNNVIQIFSLPGFVGFAHLSETWEDKKHVSIVSFPPPPPPSPPPLPFPLPRPPFPNLQNYAITFNIDEHGDIAMGWMHKDLKKVSGDLLKSVGDVVQQHEAFTATFKVISEFESFWDGVFFWWFQSCYNC